MICEDVRAAMGSGEICEETEAGARVITHCLYPSFEPVAVFVTKLGEGYRVTDAGGAVSCAWRHGRDEALTRRTLSREASRYHLRVISNALVSEVPSIDWLRAAILATANASAYVAHVAIGKTTAAAEVDLKEKIRSALLKLAPEDHIGTDVEVTGRSGDTRNFDYGVRVANDNLLLVSAVAPHHSSVAAKFVAFADTKDIDSGISRLAVYDRPLEKGDISLMLQVTDLVPVTALAEKARRVIAPRGMM